MAKRGQFVHLNNLASIRLKTFINFSSFCSFSLISFGEFISTILTLMTVLLHLGLVIVGVPYSVPGLYLTQGGGSPYGPGHIAGADNKRQIDENEADICRAFGKRLAEIGLKLNK